MDPNNKLRLFSYVTIRLWILQVFTVLCTIYENCNLIYAIQHKEIPKSTSPLIQVLEEKNSDVILLYLPYRKNHSFDETVLQNPPFNSLPSLHTVAAGLLASHSEEVNHRWLLPVFSGTVYLLRHLVDTGIGSCTRSLLSEYESCFQYFRTMWGFRVRMNDRVQGGKNPLLSDLQRCIEHTHQYYASILSQVEEQNHWIDESK